MYGSIVYNFSVMNENFCMMFSKFDRCEMLAVLVRSAFANHSFIG